MVDVTVTDPNGTSPISQPADQYTYVASPIIAAVSPSAGSVNGGQTVTITGTGLANASSVNFGYFPATIDSDTGSQLVVTSPSDNPGTVDITVFTAGGTSAISQPADQFTYLPTPQIASVSPPVESNFGGNQVAITGTGLAERHGGGLRRQPRPRLSAIPDNQGVDTIVAISPAATGEATGYVDVTVTTPAGMGQYRVSLITSSLRR